MARIRTIKPEFWSDEKLASLPRDCRLFFIGMWNFADDFGVAKGNPALLRSQIFPYDTDIEITHTKEWLAGLVEKGMLIPITHNGESYFLIRNFATHQVVDKRYCRSFLGERRDEVIAKALKKHHAATTTWPHSEPDAPSECLRSGPDEPSPQEMETEVDMDVEMDGHTQRSNISCKKQNAHTRELLDWIARSWPESLAMEEPFDEVQAEWALERFSETDIKRIILDMRNKGKHKNRSAYSTFASFVQRDTIIRHRMRENRRLTHAQVWELISAGKAQWEDFLVVDVAGKKLWVRKQ